jgi:phosphoserine phosphatase RsbX
MENGDAVVIREDGDGVLVAVVDALGHGPRAATVANAAVDEVTQATAGMALPTLVERVNRRLHGTRGAAALFCKLVAGSVEACSIGNVDMRCSAKTVPVVLTPGVLGHAAKAVRVFAGTVRCGDRIVIFTDGISARFGLAALRSIGRAEACRSILAQHRRAHDDATVLVADLEA